MRRRVLGRGHKVADEMGGSVDAVMGAAIGPYQKSRLKSSIELLADRDRQVRR
jgi:hypothetical protein